jgi:LmbE family N-acetylglucosaminyl deacetylase
VTTAIVGAGTPESVWSPWLTGRSWPALDLDDVEGRRVLVLASHPDDEILGAGGLISELSARGHQIVMVWASDGEASHPESSAVARPALAAIRRSESQLALRRLGVAPSATHHLALPDGGVAEHANDLRAALANIANPSDLVLAPWSADGHPDHDALGAAAAELPGTTTWHYLIWMWHWAKPADERIPWDRMHLSRVPDPAKKAVAIAAFRSQVEPLGAAVADAAILPPHVLERFLRSAEWLIT